MFTLGMGMHFHRMGFLMAVFPTLDSIIDEELLHCVKSTIIIELMIWESVRHTKLTFEGGLV